MKSIEKKYSNQAKVIFYDVETPSGKPFAEQFGILVIPTQVFLDKTGKEFYRHEGFFPVTYGYKFKKNKCIENEYDPLEWAWHQDEENFGKIPTTLVRK